MFFSQVSRGSPPGVAYQPPPTIGSTPQSTLTREVPTAGEDALKLVRDHMKVNSIIRSYQVCACVCASMRMCMHAYVQAYVRECVQACVHACIRACACVHACTCVCVCVCVCVSEHVLRLLLMLSPSSPDQSTQCC